MTLCPQLATTAWITPYIRDPVLERSFLEGVNLGSDQAFKEKASGLIIWHEQFPRDFPHSKGVVTISRFGAGYDNIDLDFCRAAGISVYTVPDYGVDEVSDFALAMILSRARGVFEYSVNSLGLVDGTWESNIISGLRRSSTVKVGIIGFGRIGKSLCRKLSAIGFKVYFYDPFVEPGIGKVFGAIPVDRLSDLYAECSIISINCPLCEGTSGLVDFVSASQCSSSPLMFVNTARGAIAPSVESIISAIESGVIYSYDGDVFDQEPVSADTLSIINRSTFLRSRLTITPHVAFYSVESFREMRERAAKNLRDGLADVRNSPYRIL